MSRKIFIGLLAAILTLSLLAMGADEQPWFDFNSCAICSKLTAMPDFMTHMHHNIVKLNNGFAMVTTADPGFVDQYREIGEQMNQVGAKLMAGEQLQMCGSCQDLGALMMRGATIEQGKLDNGDIMLLTSDDPELVAALHAHADKDLAEMEKLAATMKVKKADETK